MAGLGHKLEARQGQGLVMTPQLQQAIKLLQLNNMELAEFVEAELERNPLLERDERAEQAESEERSEVKADASDGEELSFDAPGRADDAIDADAETMYSDSKSDMAGAEPAGGAVDWSRAGKGGGAGFDGEAYDAAANSAREKTLREHLHDQLADLALCASDRMIAAHLIDLADEDGYLRADLTETAERLGVTRSETEAVLERLQQFEPCGVMARSLQECLALQLKERDRLDPAMAALVDNLPLLAKHDYAALKAACDVDGEDLEDMIAELKRLTPKPGLGFGADGARSVEPDVTVRERPDGSWAVELNTDTLPRVLMNNRYAAQISRGARSDEEKQFISECTQNASWLVKSLDQRARTILKVASEIVRQQDAFLAKGVAWLRPLNLKTVADAVSMHESTVSRVTSNKYIATPRGLFELKYFFTSSIASADGGEAYSAEAVRYRIKAMIDAETADGVLSDDAIVERLLADGVDIARRTVAKYREAMNIPSSVKRRRIMKGAG
ncbi:RNA polymerase factor sigma-54 [Alkalicaulis satelles]|uniref:RNA polymerase sigma-54 factor n=1 Tax=Alkalicaulis satelles TaxID=2609175 RepID=A0A5M6ZH24_9PROT|nr:RNA polymerase factor sigma-54 [Alkalicaulis satelles]KAA5804073.1 RNA polymerase factor sigma-54 [Alkalicaulis satelles]